MTHAYNREREYFVCICGAQKQKDIVFPQHSHLGRLREFAAKVSCFGDRIFKEGKPRGQWRIVTFSMSQHMFRPLKTQKQRGRLITFKVIPTNNPSHHSPNPFLDQK